MVSRSLAQALVVIFIIATVGAVLATVYAYQQPLERVETTTIATYRQTGTYSYMAELFPNIIYNTSTLGPGQGRLFEPILSNVSITFSYAFSGTPTPTNLSETHYAQVEFSSGKWSKLLSSGEALDWLSLNVSELNFSLFMNVTEINELFKTIDTETASTSNEYNITITPYIFQRATVGGQAVFQVFNPELSIRFRQDQGRYVDITPLNVVNDESITESVTIKNTSVETLRMASLIGAIAAGALLVVSLALYFRSKPLVEKKTIDKIISPHKEMIVDTAQVPPITKAVVETSSLDDLARTAEVLARPIMHSVIGDEHIFFILDGETKYQFKTIS